MSFDNPNDDDIQVALQTEATLLMEALGQQLGSEIGSLQAQLNVLTSLDLAQLTELQANVQALFTALDGDPASPGFQNLQALLALIDRVTALEAGKVATDAALAALGDLVAEHETRIAALEAAPSGDVTAITASVAALQTQLAGLVASNAAQAQTITTLTGRLNGVDATLASIATQLAGMATDVANATTVANAAAAAAAANATAIEELDDRHDGHHNEHRNKYGQLRRQVYATHVGLAAVAIPAFSNAFAAAKAAAIP